MKKMVLLLTLTMLIFSMGCSAQKPVTYEESASTEAQTEMDTSAENGMSSESPKYGGIQTNRKIIQNAFIQMETLAFDDIIIEIKEKTYEFGGYFEVMRVDGKRMDKNDIQQNRDANFVIRIPKEKYEIFISSFGDLGNIIRNELNSVDVTDQYIDTEARLEALKVQEERLLKILESATKIEDIITLEDRLSVVRYEIEGFQGTINKWDNLVQFTTVELSIREVNEMTQPKPDTLLTRSIDSFLSSIDGVTVILKAMVVFLFGFLPYLVILVPVGLIIRYFVNKHKDKIMHHPQTQKTYKVKSKKNRLHDHEKDENKDKNT